MNYPGLDSALQKFSDRADRVRQDLYYCDVSFKQANMRATRANLHAATYVYLAAALEAAVTDSLRAVVTEIDQQLHTFRDLRLTLLSLAQSAHFDSLQDVRGLKMWVKRADVLDSTDQSHPCPLDATKIPLDGRTIRPEHFETIWSVFGFAGRPLRSALDRLALNNLAEARNQIAHGEEDATVIAGQQSVDSTLRLVERIELIVLHLWETALSYLDGRNYLR